MQLNRNYGAITKAREFWGGNNGFLTVAVQFDSATMVLPAGSVFDAAHAAVTAWNAGGTLAEGDANQILVSNAERNLFRIAQAIGQRAVVVAVSDVKQVVATGGAYLDKLLDIADPNTVDPAHADYDPNILAMKSAGTDTTAPAGAAPIYLVTFLIERANVYDVQSGTRPGSLNIASPAPIDELATNILAINFEDTTYTQAPTGDKLTGATKQAKGVVVKVFDSLPILK